jgi:hypothetical protein
LSLLERAELILAWGSSGDGFVELKFVDERLQRTNFGTSDGAATKYLGAFLADR